MDHRPQCESYNIKFQKKTQESNFHNSGVGKDFLNMTEKALTLKDKADKFDFIKIENFYYQRHQYKTEQASQKLGEYICNTCICYF